MMNVMRLILGLLMFFYISLSGCGGDSKMAKDLKKGLKDLKAKGDKDKMGICQKLQAAVEKDFSDKFNKLKDKEQEKVAMLVMRLRLVCQITPQGPQ